MNTAVGLGVHEPGRRWGRSLAHVDARTAVVVVLVLYATVQLWDVSHYDWLRGYDAWASSRYTDVVQARHALPSPSDTDVWHNPPLFYAVAAIVQPHVAWIGIGQYKAVQLISVLAGLGVVVFSYLISRELFPRSPFVQLATLVVTATTPVLLRGSLMYHPEPLAAVLATAGLYVAVRSASRGWPVVGGALAGLLFGLGNLTRTWALAEAVAVGIVTTGVWAARRDPATLRFLVAFVGVFAVLSAPWYARQAIRHGNPLAFSKPNPSQWLPSGRPLGFLKTLDVGDVFTNPYQPTYRNVLLPVVYTDWWGDYTRSFHVPPAEETSPTVLEPRYRRPMVIQSVAGIVPTLLGFTGALALTVVSVRRRRAALGFALAAGALVLASFVGFLVHYPKMDGDNLKALYVVDIVPVAALCIAWTIDWSRRHLSRLAFAALLLWLAVTGIYDVNFLVLR